VERLTLLQVVAVSALTAAAMQLVQYEGAARADGPKAKVAPKGKTIGGPSGQAGSPQPFRFPHGKESFYIRTDSATIAGGSGAIVDEACDDKDDIAFAAACYSPYDARLQSKRMVRWTTNEHPARVECRFFNNTARPITIESHIYCLRHEDE
jgi:hypothetical protein